MHKTLEPTQDAGWVLSHEGYNVLTESAVESRFALGNGFLGMRAARSIGRADLGSLARIQQMGVLAALLNLCRGSLGEPLVDLSRHREHFSEFVYFGSLWISSDRSGR
jgi:trehalose/maltose hydrolase-like predicted phosphorylase